MATYSSLTDLQLIDLLKKEDRHAFAEIYRRYAGLLVDFASSKLVDLEDSRDIIQDIFVKIWQERNQLTVDRDVKAYLFTLTRYRIIDKIRKNSTRREYASMLNSLDRCYGATIEQELAAKETAQRIDTTLNQLSPRVKEVYLLSREENLSIPAIAAKLQVSQQTVKNQLSTALKQLRAALAVASTAALVVWLF